MTEKSRAFCIAACLGLTLILVSAASVARSEGQDSAVAFKSGDVQAIIAQLREYERKEFQQTLKYKTSSVLMSRPDAQSVEETFEVSCWKGRHLVETRDPKTGAKTVFAGSEYGQFRVDETGKEQGGGTKLSRYVAPEDIAKAQETVKKGFGVRLPLLLPLTGMPRETWSDFFGKQTRLKFTLAREQANGNIELAFESEMFSGSLTLLSASNPVALRSSRSRKNAPWVTTTERVILPAQQAAAMPRCAKLEVVMQDAVKNRLMMRATYKFSDYVVEAPSENAFRLSNYGLPDAEGVPLPSGRRRVWIWLASVAAGLFLLAGVLRYVILRRRASPAPTVPGT